MLRALPALLAGAYTCNTFAAEVTEADFLDELPVVLSVSRLSQPVNEAPAAVTIIDQEMIRASGFRDIPDLLRLVPGFVVGYTRENTWAMGYHGLGDAYSRRLQVLVDGRSIYSASYGTVFWADLPLTVEDIERIEVIRGPNAAVHGANAFSAVINIITKTAAQVEGTLLSAQVGEEGLRGLVARHGGGNDKLRYRLSFSAQNRDRFERDITQRPPVEAYELGQYFESTATYFLNGRFDWQRSHDSDLSVQFGFSRGDWNSGRDNPLDPLSVVEPREQDSRAQFVQMVYHQVVSPHREWRIQAYYTRNRFDANMKGDLTGLGLPGSFVVVDQYQLQTRASLELQVDETWSDTLRGVWGAELRHETVNSPQSFNSDRTLDGSLFRAFANIEWHMHPQWLLQGGAMLEKHYYTGTDVSPRVAISYTLAPGHVLRAGISRAYRSPTFFEQDGNQIYPVTGAPPDEIRTVPAEPLSPERLISRELAYLGRYRPAKLEWDIRLYNDRISNFIGDDDQIDFFPGDLIASDFRYDNIGIVESRGGEMQLRWKPDATFDLSVHYARAKLTARTSVNNFNEDIPQSAPRNSWGLLAIWRPAPGWETSLGAWHYDDTKWLSEGDLVQNHTRIDARIARRWRWQGQQVEAALVGQNLGEDYAEFRDTNIFSQRVYGSLSLAW